MNCEAKYLKNIENSDYMYILKEYKSLPLSDADKENFLIKSLIRDGESLLKVIKTKIKTKKKKEQ